jgi:4-amino-4-deoxy-L-arabinose transferase-like glycosyltransferase
LEITEPFVQIFVMAMVCLLPTYTFVSAMVNNDNLLATLGGAILCVLARREQTVRRALLLGLVLGLALLTKQSAVVFLPAIVLLALLDSLRQRTRWVTGLWHLGIIFGIAALLYGPWALRNWRVYGTFTPEYIPTTLKVWPSFVYGVASACHHLLKTFWAVSGISNDVAYPFPVPGMMLLVLFVVGLLRGWLSEQRADPLNLAANRPVLAAFLLAILVNVALVLRFGYLMGMGQGRHLFPLLVPIALILAAGLRSIPLRNLQLHTVGFWTTYAVAFVVFSLSRFPR